MGDDGADPVRLQTQLAEAEAQLHLAEAELRIVRQELERRASLR